VDAVVKRDAVDGVNTEGRFGTIDPTGHIARPVTTATEET
jgi:hypothetical protein